MKRPFDVSTWGGTRIAAVVLFALGCRSSSDADFTNAQQALTAEASLLQQDGHGVTIADPALDERDKCNTGKPSPGMRQAPVPAMDPLDRGHKENKILAKDKPPQRGGRAMADDVRSKEVQQIMEKQSAFLSALERESPAWNGLADSDKETRRAALKRTIIGGNQ